MHVTTKTSVNKASFTTVGAVTRQKSVKPVTVTSKSTTNKMYTTRLVKVSDMKTSRTSSSGRLITTTSPQAHNESNIDIKKNIVSKSMESTPTTSRGWSDAQIVLHQNSERLIVSSPVENTHNRVTMSSLVEPEEDDNTLSRSINKNYMTSGSPGATMILIPQFVVCVVICTMCTLQFINCSCWTYL